MFQKLHRQMTFFCAVVTGAIFIALSTVCLFFARKAIVQTSYSAFQKELSSVLTNLQSQRYISHQWLKQMQDRHHFTIFLYDNGEPVYFERLQTDEKKALRDAVLAHADRNLLTPSDGLFAKHEESTYRASARERYYVSAGYLTRGSGRISFVILYDLSHQTAQLARLTLLMLGADLVTLALLVLFSWFFTGRMLLPLETSQKKQQQFVAAASHELRAPLAVMLSGLESCEKADTPDEQRHFLSLIRQEGKRMQHLICDMLLLANADARGITLHAEELQPDDFLLSVYEKYEPLALGSHISLQLSIPKSDCSAIRADNERIMQLLSILLDNALAYTPAGGKILLLLTQSKGQATFAVADNGPSIPDEEKGRIFERFYRADKSHTDHEHFGLGLCTALEIAKAHGGRLTAADPSDCPLIPKDFADGTGVVFLFRCPDAGI